MLKAGNKKDWIDITNLEIKEMGKNGTTHVPVNYFHFGDYRYTSLNAAIAEAKREVSKKPKSESGIGKS